MTSETLRHVFSTYYDHLGWIFRKNHHPLHVLAVLNSCRESTVTLAVIVERSGLSQSTASRLLKRLCQLGIFEPAGVEKRYGQRYGLTSHGHQMLSDLEDALSKLIAPSLPPPSPDGQPDNPEELNNAASKSDPSNDPRSERAYQAMRERYPDRVNAYEKRKKKLLASVTASIRR